MIIFVFCIGLELLLVVLDILVRVVNAIRGYMNKKKNVKKPTFFDGNWVRAEAPKKDENNVF